MESLLERHTELARGCVRCFPEGSNVPVVDAPKDVRVILGRRLDRRLAGRSGRLAGGDSRAEIYLSALARCFPGKTKGGGDKVPSRAMLTNCRPHLLREFELLAPGIVIPVGGLAIKELLGIRRLSEAVGEIYSYDGVVYVPLPHPSGASTWLNVPENKARLIRALAVLGELVAAGRIGGSDA
jgi:uracil-DNA glycosylase